MQIRCFVANIFFFLSWTAEAANFFSLYDFAFNYPNNEATDLIGGAPTLKQMTISDKAAIITESSGWQNKEGGSLYVGVPSSATAFTIMSSVTLSSSQTNGIFLAATNSSVSGTPGCGVKSSLSHQELTIYMYCTYGMKTQGGTAKIIIRDANTITFGYSDNNSSNLIAFALFFQASNSSVSSFIFRPNLLSFSKFWTSSLKLTMEISGTGSVHYLGFISQELQTIEFSELSAGSNPDLKEISCLNCQGTASDLICPNKKTLQVGAAVREYFCECEDSYAFQESASSCVNIIVESTNSYCSK